MARTFGTLPAFFRSVSQMVEDGTVAKIRTGAATTLRELVDTTPVDTSQALSNWIVSTGRPSGTQRNAISPGKSGSTAEASRVATIAIGTSDLNTMLKRSSDIVYITNNEEYIADLDDGKSPQQSPGFVGRAAEVGRQSMRTTKLLVRRR